MRDDIRKTYQELVQQADRALAESARPDAIRIQIGSATCEHAAGSVAVEEEFRKHIEASGRSDIILRRTGCTGRCSCEPIVGVMFPGKIPVKYQRVDAKAVHAIFTSHVLGGIPVKDKILDGLPEVAPHQYELLFCNGVRCGRDLGFDVAKTFEQKLASSAVTPGSVRVVTAHCFGLCSSDQRGKAVHVLVRPDGVVYRVRNEADVEAIVQNHLLRGQRVTPLIVVAQSLSQRFFDLYGEIAFFNRQTRIALRNTGVVDPESIYEYVRYRGFEALCTVLEKNDPKWVVDQVTTSKLRGRGGAGFPTGRKWALARASAEPVRYIICNADEGDPGAFMDRSMLESDPFSILEGMMIGGFAIGAHRGFLYIRAEYPLAIKRVEHALAACRAHGLLGPSVLGSGYAFDLEIRLGAGAFVCGEETALIHSIEGERGQPRIRPPYPSDEGLWGKPTVINNVETFANVPVIIEYGGDWFGQIGTEKSGGTKVFALAGKIKHTGLVEVPMGTTLREVVFGIGGGTATGKRVKAVQTGGPAGGCIPEKWLDTIVDYDSLTAVGSIMGSGGMIVVDEDDCMVDVAKFFITFTQDESCGKCTPCREGTKRMLEILTRITTGKGTMQDLERLERIAQLVKKASLCGLGRAAPNPVLSTLTHYRDEYLAHVNEKRCPAHKCRGLIHYEINPEKCVGCTVCAKNCPVTCISGVRKEPHVIDQLRCIKCGRCFEVCRFDAVKRI